jgi:hydroxyacylglutathione hydrolase
MKVTERIHAIRHPFRLAVDDGVYVDRFVYSYALIGERICLIDAGVSGTSGLIEEALKSLGRSIEEVKLVLLTHAHPDHIGGCPAVRERSGAVFGAHEVDRRWIEDVERQYRERPILNFFELVAGPVAVEKVLKEGDRIEWDPHQHIRVIETPGHSLGSLSFFFEEEGALFSGDAIPAAGTLPIYVDPRASIESIKKLQKMPGVRYLFSSWHEPLTGEVISKVMEEGIQFIERIDAIVKELEKAKPSASLEELSLLALERLGIKAKKVLPMVQTSFGSHLSK